MRTLLLADDSDATQRVVELTLSGEDIRVERVTDGDQAVSRIAAERPDIVLAEIALPTRSGYDVCAFIRQQAHLADLPVLLLAGAFEPIDHERASAVRCDGILVKPFEPQQVVARVKELLQGTGGTRSGVIDGVPRAVERLGQRPAPAVPADAERPDAGANAVGDIAPESLAAAEPTRDKGTVDEYFERLDAAFANRLVGSNTPPQQRDDPAADPEVSPDADVPTLERVLTESSGGAPEETGHDSPRSAPATAASVEPAMSEEMIDEITRRVLQRIDLDLVARAVNDSIADLARRFILEEFRRSH